MGIHLLVHCFWLKMIVLVLLCLLAYIYYKYTFEYWKRRNVPGPTPLFFVGNIGPTFFKRKSMGEIVTEIYRRYEHYPLVGMYKAGTPCLIARDPDFIKQVTVKNFKSFEGNDLSIPIKSNRLVGKNPFALKGNKWKEVRGHLTPSFTKGKIKAYFTVFNHTSLKMVDYIRKKIDQGNAILDCKEEMGKFTLENVANCSIGWEAKAFEDDYSDFKYIADNYITPGLGQLKTSFTFIFPWLFDTLGIEVFKAEVDDMTDKVVEETLWYRYENKIERHDLLYQLEQIRLKDSSFTKEDISAGVSALVMDGYDTSSNVMSYIVHELSLHEDKQSKLREEIEDYFEKCNGNLTFEEIHNLRYLDAVVSEGIRLHPIFLSLGKTCREKFIYETKNTSDLKKMRVSIEPGVVIMIPYEGLHRDPKYFSDPNEFIPERFLDENIDNLPKYVYMPFGEGPKSCLGRRFGLTQLKVGIAHLINNFKLRIGNDMEIPLRTEPWHFVVTPVGGIRVRFEKI